MAMLSVNSVFSNSTIASGTHIFHNTNVWKGNMSIRPLSKFALKTPEGRANLHKMLKTYTKVVWVRHPITRLVSAWNSKLRYGDNSFYVRYGKQIVRQYRNMSAGRPNDDVNGTKPTLEEFFKYLSKTVRPFSTTDVHCKFIFFYFVAKKSFYRFGFFLN